MPNHITNRVQIIGSKKVVTALMKKICNKTKGEEMIIDFNQIIPMPVELLEVRSPHKIISEREFLREQKEIEYRRKVNPNDIMGFSHNLTQKMHDDYVKRFGAIDWYGWSVHNWGTKWNAYSQEMTTPITVSGKPNDEITVEFKFETAWATPEPVLRKLSEQFPDVIIRVKYADEDAGSNLGKYHLKCGILIYEWHPEGDRESMDFYLEVCPDARAYYELVDDEWRYKED